MSVNITFDGQPYIIPETGEVGWGGNTTSYLVAIAAGALQKTGGSFTLSAETDFGADFGLQALSYKSRTANIAAAGILRLANNSDNITWRNAANSADLSLLVNASNQLTFDGIPLAISGGGTVNLGTQFQLGYYATGGTAISGLALITASRALASDINGLPVAATTTTTELQSLAGLTASRALQTDSSGLVSISATTAAELAFVSGVTSAIQTQIDSKATDSLVVHIAGTETITGEKTFSDGAIFITRNYTGQTRLEIKNESNTDNAFSNIVITGQSTTIVGSVVLRKLPPATTDTVASGLSLSNTFLVTPAGDTISRIIFDLATSINGIYFSGANSNEHVQIDNTGHIIVTSTTNQLVLGLTNTMTISASAPSASRILTIPDPGASASFVMTQGAQTIVGQQTFSAAILIANGSVSLPSLAFALNINSGLFRAGTNNPAISSNGALAQLWDPTAINFYIGGTLKIQLATSDFSPATDNSISNGTVSKRWSDLRSVLINGADYGFANGWFIREYPATFKDIQTHDAAWLKANANKGLQIVNDRGEVAMVIGDDGTLYVKEVKSLNDLDTATRAKNITSDEDKLYEIERRKEILDESNPKEV